MLNRMALPGYALWVGRPQSVFGKAFAPFGLVAGTNFMEYDLVYLSRGMLFWGARSVDGRGFDTEQNRPTNLQIPMVRAGALTPLPASQSRPAGQHQCWIRRIEPTRSQMGIRYLFVPRLAPSARIGAFLELADALGGDGARGSIYRRANRQLRCRSHEA